MKEEWIDPDDAPEADEEWFKNAHVYIGDTLIKRGVGRPPIKNAKEMLSLRLDQILMCQKNYVQVVRDGKPA